MDARIFAARPAAGRPVAPIVLRRVPRERESRPAGYSAPDDSRPRPGPALAATAADCKGLRPTTSASADCSRRR